MSSLSSFGGSRLWAVFLLGLAVGLCGCGPSGGAAAGGKPGAAVAATGGMPVMRVIAVPARRQPVHEELSLVGSITANEQIEVRSESEGFVEAIRFHEGQAVKKGELLVTLDETKLQAALEEAEASLKLSRQTYERSKELLASRLVSQQEFDQASSRLAGDEASVAGRRRQLKDARVSAPFAGVLGARMISPGQLVNRNSTLTWLVDVDPVKVEFNIPERFLSQVKVGQDIVVGVAAYPGKQFKGKVFFIAPSVDVSTRTVLMKAGIPNPELLLKPGMFASLELTLQIRANAIVVPEAAISQVLDGNAAVLMQVKSDLTVGLLKVKVGLRLPGLVEIVEGLKEGEKVVVEGLQKIGPGMTVELAPDADAKPYLPSTP